MKTRFVIFAAMSLFLLAVQAASAQNPPATESYTLRIYSPGAAVHTTSSIMANVDITCDQAPAPSTATNVNPTKVEWDDPARVGRKCVWLSPVAITSAPLVALPIGAYEGTIVLVNEAGQGGESNRAPFTRAPLPAARTGLRFVR